MRQIPLRARDGAVRARAVVDDEDFEWLGQWRWHLHSQGYAVRTVRSGGKVAMHRAILERKLGIELGDDEGHHDNEDKLDNRRGNLQRRSSTEHRRLHAAFGRTIRPHREATAAGVTWDRGKWVAYANRNGKQHRLGRFADRAAAIHAREEFLAAT